MRDHLNCNFWLFPSLELPGLSLRELSAATGFADTQQSWGQREPKYGLVGLHACHRFDLVDSGALSAISLSSPAQPHHAVGGQGEADAQVVAGIPKHDDARPSKK